MVIYMKKNGVKIVLISLGLLIILGILLVLFLKKGNDEPKVNVNYSPKTEIMNVNFESRKDTMEKYNYNNYFTVGWLQVQGTNIDFPIFTPIVNMLEEEGEIEPDFSYGWRHINYKLGENRMVLSSHNILNVSSKPIKNSEMLSDFESLMTFVYYDFAKENQYIMYTDEHGNENMYVIYSIGFDSISKESYNSISYNDKNNLNKYINNVKKNSIYNYSVDVSYKDDLISLVTCTRFFGLNGDTLFRVDARKVRKNEKIYKNKVDKNDNYNEIDKKLSEESV